MALIQCPECGRSVSTAAQACPVCGFPMAQQSFSPLPASGSSDELLAEVRPSWWRYFWYLLFFWLIIPWFIAWIKRSSVVLRIYQNRVTLRRGLLSKCERELFTNDIRSIDIDQNLIGRLMNIGDLAISTAAAADATENILGVANPQKVRDLIVAQRRSQSHSPEMPGVSSHHPERE